MMILSQSIRIVGCGDIGRRVARLYQNDGRGAIGWVRGEASHALGQAQGIIMRQIDLDDASQFEREDWIGCEVFWFAPPSPAGILDKRLRRFLATVQDAPKRVVLISTTGVYGDSQGHWIDESAVLCPATERSIRRLDAEIALHEWMAQCGTDGVILRVPGIYALDRLPLERLKRGDPVIDADQAPWTNRIHADDLAMLAKAAMERAPKGAIYNATDGNPSTMTDYFNQVADHMGLPRPPQISVAEAKQVLSAGMLNYLQESRRIRNDKILHELGVGLQYPSLAEALRN